MDCKEARSLIDANADRELPAPDARRVDAHLAGCAECRRTSESVRALGDALRAAAYQRAPDALRERIVAALPPLPEADTAPQTSSRPDPARAAPRRDDPSDGERGRRARGRWRWPIFGPQPAGGAAWSVGWAGALVIALAAAAGAAGLTLALDHPAGTGPLADELVASHVRALLSERDLDVESTDQHTVKPWFNGRIDYAPPVEDLAASGFPLVGGRLDYFAQRRVAVLIYRYRKHPIDVYVFPASAGDAQRPPAALVREGYALARWQDGGMTYWAITDASPDALAAFKAALASRLRGAG
jgi:anti-sigma factor RsiW